MTRTEQPAGVVSATLAGLDARLVRVATRPTREWETFAVSGCPLDDALARAKLAIDTLAPATQPSRVWFVDAGPGPLDAPGIGLACALAVAVERGALRADALARFVFWADVQPDGSLSTAVGARVVADVVRELGDLRLVVAPADVAVLADTNLEIVTAATLGDLIAYLRNRDESSATDHARLAVECMLAGGHDLLMVGSHGELANAAVEHFARLVDFELDDAQRAAKIYGLLGLDPPRRMPVRVVGRSVKPARLLGQDQPARPGEIHLAAGGVLVLDGCTRATLAASWSVARRGRLDASEGARFPTPFAIATRLQPGRLANEHANRAADLVVTLPSGLSFGPGDATRTRLALARSRQRESLAWTGYRTGYRCNAAVPASGCLMDQLWPLTDAGRVFTERVEGERGRLMLRRVARTLADLGERDVAEPLGVDVLAMAACLMPHLRWRQASLLAR